MDVTIGLRSRRQEEGVIPAPHRGRLGIPGWQDLIAAIKATRRRHGLRDLRARTGFNAPSVVVRSGSNTRRIAMPKAVIIGVGPDRGLGAQLCKRFLEDAARRVIARVVDG
jgi:hypothetical protein